MEFLHTMRNISSMVSDTLSKTMVEQCCKASEIDTQDFVSKSMNLETHFPKFEEIYQMSTLPSLWSDLFSIECKMLCNPILLNTNIDITKMMCSYVSRRPVDAVYSKRMDLLSHIYSLSNTVYNNETESDTQEHVDKIEVNKKAVRNKNHKITVHTLGENDTHSNVLTSTNTHRQSTGRSQYNFNASASELNENYSTNRNSIDSTITTSTMSTTRNNSLPLTNVNQVAEDPVSIASLFSIISNLSVYNERLADVCAEDRKYYDNCCKRLYYLSEEELLNRPEFIKRSRPKVLQFLRQFSRAMGIDKCTHNLSILFFDCYLNQITGNQSSVSRNSWSGVSSVRSDNVTGSSTEYVPFTDNELLKIATACYLLASGLREHWVDLSKDKYLQHAVEMSYNAFTTREVISVQLDVLHRMPKGFTCVYTCMEYGLFFLANIKYINHDLGASSASSSSTSMEYFDDFLLLSSSFNFMVKTGSLCWLYHCLTKWDDYYVTKNWNRFIPPSRCAAVLIFHFFITFFNVDFEKDLVWCRRFCHRAFKMFFDSDVALWYIVFRENIRSFLACLEKSSDRMFKMRGLFDLSSNAFRAVESIVYLYHTRIILSYFFDGAKCRVHKRAKSVESKLDNGKTNCTNGSNSLDTKPLSDSNPKPDQPSKNDAMDLDPQHENGFNSTNNLFGLDYDMVSFLFSNLIEVLKKS